MNAFLKCFKLFEWAVGEPDPDPGLDSILKLSFSLGNADLKSQTIINYKITKIIKAVCYHVDLQMTPPIPPPFHLPTLRAIYYGAYNVLKWKRSELIRLEPYFFGLLFESNQIENLQNHSYITCVPRFVHLALNKHSITNIASLRESSSKKL
ncbi:hypothetical protein BpHYR1_033621 [Brachionus plicatilis]|uniref:Uncharacterized protein n=1 Tax=Brachionus plicatilis TaxID=10195 RepID=A0A3M7SYH1_BRAPC|nr:hypothetical protein BpHYR1_033621 [Brachionus plicatilis]